MRRPVYTSSSSAYRNSERPCRVPGEEALGSPYGRTKVEAEQECVAAAGRRLEVVAVRHSTAKGPGQRPDMGLPLLAEAALAERQVTLFRDGPRGRGITFVADTVRATCSRLTPLLAAW